MAPLAETVTGSAPPAAAAVALEAAGAGAGAGPAAGAEAATEALLTTATAEIALGALPEKLARTSGLRSVGDAYVPMVNIETRSA